MKYRYRLDTFKWEYLRCSSLKRSKFCHDDMFRWILIWKFHWKLFEANDRIINKIVDGVLNYDHMCKLYW